MLRWFLGIALANVLVVAMLATAAPSTARAQSADELAALNERVVQLHGQGKYAEAGVLAEQVLAANERVLGPEHPDTLRSVNNLGFLYQMQGRYGEAEPLLKRALAGSERTLGPEHSDTLLSVNNLGLLYQAQGHYDEAEPLYQRSLAGRERALGPEHLDTLASVTSLGLLYQEQGRYGDAEPLLRRALAGAEKTLGPEHPDLLTNVTSLGLLFQEQGRYGEAEPLLKRALASAEKVLGPEHPDTLTSLNNLASVYNAQGRYGEAEPLYKWALAGTEKVLGPEHPRTLTSVGNLAALYDSQGRYGEAETLYSRAVKASERVLGPEHPDTLTNVDNLAGLYHVLGRYVEAEPLFRRTLAAKERVLGREHPSTLTSVNNLAAVFNAQKRYGEAEPLFHRVLEAKERVLGREHPSTLTSVNSLAMLYVNQGRYAEAEPLLKRALDSNERVLGREHPDTLRSVHNLAFLHQNQGRHGEAEPLLKRALDVHERVLGYEHPHTLHSANNLAFLYRAQGRDSDAERLHVRVLEASERVLGLDNLDTLLRINNLAGLYFRKGDWLRAAQLWRRSTAAIAVRTRREALDTGKLQRGKTKSEAAQWGWQFLSLIKAVHRLTPEGGSADSNASVEMFQVAQRVLGSEAAHSLAQMAVRGAKGDPALAVLVRERQDKLDEWYRVDAWRNAALGQGAAKRDAKAEADNLAQLGVIDVRIAEIDKRLAVEFPDYFTLASPEPLSVEDVQAQLGTDEALILFLDTPDGGAAPEETFIWIVTKTAARWVRSDLGTPALTREVRALRCGLDEAEWVAPANATRCGNLLGLTDAHDPSRPLPFDLDRVHALYQALFGQIEDLIKGKHLLIVPSGPLTQVPFQVLVMARPTKDGYKSAAWLARDHALTVLPAVSSLKALRRLARPSAAAKPMIGFGNPPLDGPDNRYAKLAQLARDNQRCGGAGSPTVTAFLGARGVTPLQMGGGLAKVSDIRIQAPLPETADELCAVAGDLRADLSEIRLGARATEREVRALSDSGQLADYRVLHFATHGAMAGELSPGAEPGLILTPPSEASAEDDGYLSASEIAGLKLDADWVILSACNTAAGDASGAQALSGLARAFFYAQARALLVSHWAVNSDATVKLITTAMREMSQDRRIGRAEALRRAMLALIDRGKSHEAHPAFWAPFIVVGEGAR